ncbi:MAG: MYG1 family protein, partial [Spirochaetaceae bacterium]|nr:MYG1 family protein [Spirochaetaceae bacterium]
MPYTVITHAGKAHIDEVLAIAALAVSRKEYPAEIQRINSNDAAEMVASGNLPQNCWVIDCGLEFNPERRLFDHHQDRELPSAAFMLFTHLFPELEGTDLHKYFELVSRVDTRGARSLEDFESVGESRDYWSFSQQLLVRTFE